MAESEYMIKDITLPNQVFDIGFHPSRDMIASGQISGQVTIHTEYFSSPKLTISNCMNKYLQDRMLKRHSFANDGNKLLMELRHHKRACRAVAFSSDGLYLMTASKDKSLQAVDMNTGSVCHAVRKAHNSPINCLKILRQNLLATGDDDGDIKLWDTRTASTVAEFSENEDYISSMECDKDNRVLLAASGDGTLSVLNIRRKRFEARSENQENELLSLAKVKGGTKVVCGTSEGTLHIFSWNNWTDMSDRFPGHPMSVDACVALNEDIICTGSMDGIIRAVSILPNSFLGVVGEHGEFPVEQIRLSPQQNILASCSHDQKVKFWDVSHFRLMSGNQDKPKTAPTKSLIDENFFEDL